ncbi:MAG: fibronectin type III domain-containing protein [Clostridia bacterium]|nr:fibronectin type III domain-containing protein [Clostridia bacterium]
MLHEKPARGSTPQPDHIMISLNGDAKTCMAVTWRTSTDVTDGYVLYREYGTDEYQKHIAETEVFESDIDISNIFWAKLNGLKPGTKYYYTCGNDTYRSEEYFFTTQPESIKKFKFLVVSDQQKGDPFETPDYSYFNTLIKDFLKKHPDTAFILTAGDNTDCGQHEQQWNGAFLGWKGIAEYVPIMFTEGNHDTRGFKDYRTGTGRYYSEPAEFFCKQLKGSYPYNGPEGWKTENYTFDYANAHFTVLGVNGPEDVNAWLVNDLKNSKADWNIGTYHFPVCYTGSDCQNYDCYPVMTEGMEMLDLLFSGHEHSFGRSFPRKNEELFEQPSKGMINYIMGNSNQNPPGTRSLSKVWHSAFYPMEDRTSMVAVAEVEGKKLTITAELEDGRIADKCIIDKERDLIEPYALAPYFNRTRMMYKGADLGLCQYQTTCEEHDGVWFGCLCVLFSYFGGFVQKTENQVYLEGYGHWARFTQDSDIAETDRGEVKLEKAVYRNAERKNQLYIPMNAVEIFDMRWAYAKRNNFILVEHESEDKPITVQP